MMSSLPLKTQIVRVECNESDESDYSLSSDSDHELDDNRYGIECEDKPLSASALTDLKSLYIKNNFHKLEIIQSKSGDKDVVKSASNVCHLVLTDQRVDDTTVDEFTDCDKKYVFKSKSKFLKELELKAKQRVRSCDKKAKTITKSDVQINLIPKTFEEFLQIILDLNAVLIEDENSKLFFREETHNREIRFQNHSSYINAFNPFVVRELWSALKKSRKGEVSSYCMTYKKSTDSDNEIVCTHIRHKSCNHSVFTFGQIVVINYYLSDEKVGIDGTEKKLWFGIVREMKTRLIDKTSDLLLNSLLKSQTNCEENHYIFEEITIYCNPLEENFEKISVIPLICIQKYLLEARVVFELKDPKFEKIFAQILKPIFKFAITGLSVDLEHRKDLYDVQKDAIQKAYEVCGLPSMDGFSSFVAVWGPPKSGKTETLKETILQLLRKSDIKVKKLIVVTIGSNELKAIIDFLKKEEIKVYHIVDTAKDVCLSHKKLDFRRKIKRMNKELVFEDIIGKDEESYERCLKYYNEDIQLEDMSEKEKYVKEQIEHKVSEKLMVESEVLIGSIGSIMNNGLFNVYYNSNPDNDIVCALVDNAHIFTETEILTLLYAGVRRFALFGDSLQNTISFEKCESFFQRYVRLFGGNFRAVDAKNHSVVHLREGIGALQRYSNNNRHQSRASDRGGRSRNNRFSEYRKHSNYGSEYFDRNNRFKNTTYVKNESKDDIKLFGADNSHPNSYAKPEPFQSGYSEPNRFNRPQFGHNLMTDGIASQFAFGKRDPYLERTTHSNHNYNQPFGATGMSSSNSDMNFGQTSSQNSTGFVQNPSRHQNYNLF